MDRTAMVLGATGLVGREVTGELLRGGWREVRTLTRRPLDVENGRLSQHLIDWERLDEYGGLFEGVDALFCCLGTTIKQAGSQANFERVDLEYPLKAAKLAHRAGVKQLLVVSAMGANPRSRQFYSRTKGRMEEGLSQSGIPGVHLFRPSLLLGERDEFRRGERAAAFLMTRLEFLMVGRVAKYRAVKGSAVARAMVHIADASLPGIHVYPNDVIRALGLQ
ncbi:NAD(P)H-binding protein [Paenibacillus sp. HN-1]|uniref:NAD(P)H-binding protein n=1 Tax=Paenibacillus TaxID=44249 RepID=UPI001CA8F4BA|nr:MULTISPECIES: NAD(P)H-binding protein [Paenibacillus]MBY9079968.1 NAD(P)H-binding protein [Paenibacillus sp. CGMCC 1.18879]MBY9084610.1 NAD(P)H-binding protein [Paenibacillus sinensis]